MPLEGTQYQNGIMLAPTPEAFQEHARQMQALRKPVEPATQAHQFDYATEPMHECEVVGCESETLLTVTHTKLATAEAWEEMQAKGSFGLPEGAVAGGQAVSTQIPAPEIHWVCADHQIRIVSGQRLPYKSTVTPPKRRSLLNPNA